MSYIPSGAPVGRGGVKSDLQGWGCRSVLDCMCRVLVSTPSIKEKAGKKTEIIHEKFHDIKSKKKKESGYIRTDQIS